MSDKGELSVATGFISVCGARVHNLKNVDVNIPLGRLVVITGPSGSGKSSLAFDTLHAEGQRQYLETLTPYMRRVIPQLERPDVDWVEGLPPTVAIDQRGGPPPPRSTVGTLTEVYDLLRLLYVRVGELRCPNCSVPVVSQSPQEICQAILSLPEGTRVILLAPLPIKRSQKASEIVATIRKLGFPRIRLNGQLCDLDELTPQAVEGDCRVEVVVDRVIIKPAIETRLRESLHTALRISDGQAVVSYEARAENGEPCWIDRVFSTVRRCPRCGEIYPEVDLRTLSFYSPQGACPQCEGLGLVDRFDPNLVIDFSRGLENGAVRLWKDARAKLKHHAKKIERLMNQGGFDWSTPLQRIPEEFRIKLIYGTRASAQVSDKSAAHSQFMRRTRSTEFVGLLQLLEVEYELLAEDWQRREWAAFRSQVACPSCQGAGLGPLGRSVTVQGMPIHVLCARTIPEIRAFLELLNLPPYQQNLAAPIVKEILHRLDFLAQVGLDYVTLDRRGETLSGGELQRVRLAAGLGAVLSDVCYIVDEPSIGLHPRDNDRLIASLRQLVDRGNTVIVVEHDEAIIRAADWVIDMGPSAGPAGGRVVAEGTAADIMAHPHSITGRYLAGRDRIPIPTRRRQAQPGREIVLVGATTNNLKNITVEFPLGLFICVTGVSGSGKSSLLSLTLAPALKRALLGLGSKGAGYDEIRGFENVERVVDVDQTPIGRSPRSNVATYTGVFDEIRRVFATTRDARRLGFRADRFSFNNPAGRCPACQGLGQQKIEMDFLPDMYVTCPACLGRRFNRQTLEVRYRDKTIADVLEMSIEEALKFFENFPAIETILRRLCEVGLGYLQLGQKAVALSGGEAQRIKLATELARGRQGKTVYLLDEPTTGLHKDDVRRLLAVLHQLVDSGNTVVVVEHHLDLIKSADWVIELGPEGGRDGGNVVAVGTPEEIARNPHSPTGQYLAPILQRG
ncbi:excinuclease ABC subunit UvrA [Thermogutta sp.]|uniref:excinuclease ABC subunit UvrA n=1 Tax=Thermogutta sp. TaxID=1962930 RepID=UPI00321F7835